jgi:hypothetical protein
VSPQSAETVYEKLGSPHKQLLMIKAERHGILMENLGGTWEAINEFLKCYRPIVAAAAQTSESFQIQEVVS